MDDILDVAINGLKKHIEDLERSKQENPEFSKQMNDDEFIRRYTDILHKLEDRRSKSN